MTIEEIIAQEDPRENMNVVFIGHVDAGKSTICGSIMYITGMVDKRTIEKFEREAKVRNRESWFLAYIMDTNEEERAKVGEVDANHGVGYYRGSRPCLLRDRAQALHRPRRPWPQELRS